MNTYNTTTEKLKNLIPELRVGDKVFLSGTVYTARDAAHSRIMNMINNHEELPFKLDETVIYYAGPTPTKPDGQIGSFGPTTSARMDAFSPTLCDLGLLGMIGKGERNKHVTDAIIRNCSVYFCACGGLGALISKSIIESEVIAFPELGCESIKKLTVESLPLIVAIDCKGNSLFSDYE